MRAPRRRSRLSFRLLALIALGLLSRAPSLPAFVLAYVGDVLWGSMFFVWVLWLRPRASPRAAWLVSTASAELIELSQLWRAPVLEAARATRLGGLLLGHTFLWSDVLCIVLGTSAALLVDRGWRGCLP